MLPANTVRHAEASYLLNGEPAGRFFVIPRETDIPELLPGGQVWQEAQCGFAPVWYVPRPGGYVLYRAVRQRYGLLVLLPEPLGAPVQGCGIIRAFVEPFEFFLDRHVERVRTFSPPPEFPAVLDLGAVVTTAP